MVQTEHLKNLQIENILIFWLAWLVAVLKNGKGYRLYENWKIDLEQGVNSFDPLLF